MYVYITWANANNPYLSNLIKRAQEYFLQSLKQPAPPESTSKSYSKLEHDQLTNRIMRFNLLLPFYSDSRFQSIVRKK